MPASEREFVPESFSNLSPAEALYVREKFTAASEMKSAIKRFLDAECGGQACTSAIHQRLRQTMEDWLNVPLARPGIALTPEGHLIDRCFFVPDAFANDGSFRWICPPDCPIEASGVPSIERHSSELT